MQAAESISSIDMSADVDRKAMVALLHQRLQQPDGQVERDLLAGGEVLDSQTLERWLRADSWKIDKAERRLRTHAQWRKDYVPTGRIDESEVKDEIASGKVFIQGVDKAGRPCMYVVAAKHLTADRDVEQCKRFICYSLDRAIEQIDPQKDPMGSITVIFDLRGMGLASCDVTILRAVFDTLANHYPERMGQLWMYDAPLVFWGLWKVVSPFIDPTTSKKIVFLYEKDPSQMCDSFDPEELPAAVGGRKKLVPVAEAAAAYRANTPVSSKPNGIVAGANGTLQFAR